MALTLFSFISLFSLFLVLPLSPAYVKFQKHWDLQATNPTLEPTAPLKNWQDPTKIRTEITLTTHSLTKSTWLHVLLLPCSNSSTLTSQRQYPDPLAPWQSWAHWVNLLSSTTTRLSANWMTIVSGWTWSAEMLLKPRPLVQDSSNSLNWPPWVLTQETILPVSLSQKSEEQVKKQKYSRDIQAPLARERYMGKMPKARVGTANSITKANVREVTKCNHWNQPTHSSFCDITIRQPDRRKANGHRITNSRKKSQSWSPRDTQSNFQNNSWKIQKDGTYRKEAGESPVGGHN